jgi:opacity protein-like surface antigen
METLEAVMRFHSSRLALALSFILVAALCATARAQTDLALNLYGAFSGTTNTNTTGNATFTESPSNAAGGMFELRHIRNPLIGYEATYSFNRANQVYSANCSLCTPVGVSANAHEITGDWVVSLHAANLRPFGLLGLGLLLNQPTSGQAETRSSNQAVYVYGAGLDWGVLPHIGLRFQYRGNLHRAPDITTAYGVSTLAYSHTAEPMIGAYFRF